MTVHCGPDNYLLLPDTTLFYLDKLWDVKSKIILLCKCLQNGFRNLGVNWIVCPSCFGCVCVCVCVCAHMLAFLHFFESRGILISVLFHSRMKFCGRRDPGDFLEKVTWGREPISHEGGGQALSPHSPGPHPSFHKRVVTQQLRSLIALRMDAGPRAAFALRAYKRHLKMPCGYAVAAAPVRREQTCVQLLQLLEFYSSSPRTLPTPGSARQLV